MKLYLVRHAQSKGNIGTTVNADPTLTKTGHIQARRAGLYFSERNMDQIYCSPSKRTRLTLKEIMPYLDQTPIDYTAKIIERNLGIYNKNGKNDWTAFFKDASKEGIDFNTFRPKNGESVQDVFDRARDFLTDICNKHIDSNVLVVGHEMITLCIILAALNLEIIEENYFSINNASVSVLNIENNCQVTEFNINDCNHLITGAVNESIKTQENYLFKKS